MPQEIKMAPMERLLMKYYWLAARTDLGPQRDNRVRMWHRAHFMVYGY